MYKPDNNLVSLNLQLGPKCLLDSNDASYLQKKNFTGSPPNSLKYISTKNIEKQNNPSSKNSNLTSKENQSNIFLQNEEDDERTKIKKWRLITAVKKMKCNLINLLKNRNIANLNQYHLQIFQEEYSENENENKQEANTLFNRIIWLISRLFSLIHFPVIFPNNKIKIFWDFFIMMVILAHFYIIVINLCLIYELETLPYEIIYENWRIAIIIIFFVDILHKLNAGYFIQGLQMNDRKSIVRRYFESDFLYDFLSFIGLLSDLKLLDDSISIRYRFFLKLFFFFKYPLMEKLIRNVEEVIKFDEKIIAILSLVKLFIKMLFLAHIIACLWFLMPNLADEQNNWMVQKGILDKSVGIKYVISLYWALVTIATIGYGDITPQNEYEYMFSMSVIVVGSIFFGYSLTAISSIFIELEKEELNNKEKMRNLNIYMNKNKFDFETKIQIKKYMNFLWEIENQQNSEVDQEIFGKLTSNLKEKILLQTYGKILFKIPMFTKNFSRPFLIKLLSIMKSVSFDPNSMIYSKGDHENIGLYIIDHGEISLSFTKKNENSKEICLSTVKDGEVLGDLEFFTKNERNLTAKSVSYTTAYVIYLRDFELLLQKFPEDFEKYFLIRDQIMLYRNYTLLYHNRCSSCSKTTHLTSDCPIINAQFNPKLIISRENFPIFNKRSQHLRRANRNHCFTIPNVEIELDFNKKQVSTFESKNIEEIDEEVEKIEEKKELFYNFNEFSEIESNKTDQMSLPLLKQDSPLLKQNSPFLKHDPPLMNPFIPLSKLNSPLLKQNSPLLKQNSPFLKQNSPLLKQNSPHLKKKDLKLTVKLTEIEKQLEKLSDSITNPKIAFETEEINVSFGTKKNAIVEPSPINKLNKSAFQSWKIKNMNSLNSLNSSKIIESVIEKNENSLEKNENIIFSQFEKMHTFEKYFHNGNYVNVLLKIQKTMNTTSRTKKKKEESFLPILKAKLGTQRLKTNFKMLKSQKKRRSPTESLKRRLSKFKF